MSWRGRYWRLAHVGHAVPHKNASTRDVSAFLAKVTAEAWGPLDERTRAEVRQRIAQQKAKDGGAGGLF